MARPTDTRSVGTWVRRWLRLWRDEPVVVDSPLSREAAVSALAGGITGFGSMFARSWSFGFGPRVVRGRVTTEHVRLAAMKPGFRNSWRPVFRGRWETRGTTTQLVGKIGWHPAVKIFSAVWLGGVACFLVTGLIGGLDLLAQGRPADAGGWFAFSAATIAFVAFFAGPTWFAGRSGKKDEEYLRQWLQDRLQTNAWA